MGQKPNALRPPIDRRQFVELCTGSLALAAVACRRNEDPAYSRGSTLVMAVSDVNDIKPDVTDLDFLTFLPSPSGMKEGSSSRGSPGAGSTPPTIASGPTISALASAGMTATR